jgi:phage terminase large subunit-like protein
LIFTGGAPGGKYENPLWYLDEPGYNAKIADRAVAFFPQFLKLPKGRWGGQPFELLPWEEHRIIRPLFGILREQPSKARPNGLRRIQMVYCEIPKKNGKSPLAAGIGCKLFRADRERYGNEVYAAACDRDQATIIHGLASEMVRNSPKLSENVRIRDSTKRMIFRRGQYYGIFQALSNEVPSKHGWNPHGILFDELHAQPNDELWNTLTKYSGIAREQPVTFAITTAGYDRMSICWKQREYAIRVLLGEVDDPRFLPVIFGLDPEEDWESEENWKAVNPSMGHIFTLEDFRADYRKAVEMPAERNLFRRLRLNQWTEQAVEAIPMNAWRQCGQPFDQSILNGKFCLGGLDLATVQDLAAYILVFPPQEGLNRWYVRPYLYCPEETIDLRTRRDNVPYADWVREGYLTATPGRTIDYKRIEADIRQTHDQFKLGPIGYDRYGAYELVTNMTAEGIEMLPVGMGFVSLNAPFKRMLSLVLNGELAHGGHPVLEWMARNCGAEQDAAGNLKPAKNASKDKIDGIIALCCALSMAMGCAPEEPSVYETHGLQRIGEPPMRASDEIDFRNADETIAQNEREESPEDERARMLATRYGI